MVYVNDLRGTHFSGLNNPAKIFEHSMWDIELNNLVIVEHLHVNNFLIVEHPLVLVTQQIFPKQLTLAHIH